MSRMRTANVDSIYRIFSLILGKCSCVGIVRSSITAESRDRPLARKNKRRRSVASKPANSLSAQPMSSAPPIASEPSQGGIRSAGSRLLDSALDYALERLWEFAAFTLGGAAVTALGFVFVYFKRGAASWFWPWLTHALSFWGGAFLFMAILMALSWRKAIIQRRGERAIQDAKNLHFASDELGFIDFFANKERAEKATGKCPRSYQRRNCGVRCSFHQIR